MAIQKQTKLIVADNSGALEIMCFHVVGSTGKVVAHVGDRIVATVKKSIPGGQIKKGTVVSAVVVRTKKKIRRQDGSFISFSQNAAVLLKGKEDFEPRGTRIFGPVLKEVRAAGFTKIVSLASGVI
jgi:large subunit ribosomal protein L14